MKKTLFLVIAALSMLACQSQNDPVSTSGMLPGNFSVSASHKVHFSQGNLQYQASTNTWRFAENQYDTIGAVNSNISATYDGWIDLFGWGTGHNPNKTSIDENDYGSFADWGTNAISNGGNKANHWRTLKKEEWIYLFYERVNAATLFGLGSVNGVNGMIILPDKWKLPDGADFIPSTTIGMVDWDGYYRDGFKSHFSDNCYDAAQWEVMEYAGAVFLPTAGYCHDSTEYNVGTAGYYWAATPCEPNTAYSLNFYSYDIRPQGSSFRSYGQSVRLVR